MKTYWMDRPVVITGGAGFIGSNLARALVKQGSRVRIIDNLERGRLEYINNILDKIEFIQADLRNGKEALHALKGAEVVFHLAAQVGGIKVYMDRPGSLLNNNLLIDNQVFNAAVELKTPCLFYASSAHVYPRHLQQSPESRPLREDDAEPANPVLTYGWGKRVGEITLLNLAKECPWMRVAIARIMGAYGYNQDIALSTGSVIPVFCHRTAIWPKSAPFRIWGTGLETRSYIFIDDVVKAMLLCSIPARTRRITGPFNLATTGRVTIRQIADMIINLSNKKIPLEFDDSVTTAIWGQAADCDFAGKLLDGWTPLFPMSQGLKLTYQHVLQRIKEFTDEN